jgi:hypothetical protein
MARLIFVARLRNEKLLAVSALDGAVVDLCFTEWAFHKGSTQAPNEKKLTHRWRQRA